MNDESITLSAKQYRTIIAGIVSGVLLVSGIAGTGIVRVDKFGASDFEKYSESLKADIEFRIRVLNYEIRKDMPPAATKARIRNIERFLEDRHADFEPATDKWQ